MDSARKNLVSRLSFRDYRCFHLLSPVHRRQKTVRRENNFLVILSLFCSPDFFFHIVFMFWTHGRCKKALKIDPVYIGNRFAKSLWKVSISRVNLISVICFDAHRESVKLVMEKRCKTYIRRVINFTVPFIRNHRQEPDEIGHSSFYRLSRTYKLDSLQVITNTDMLTLIFRVV